MTARRPIRRRMLAAVLAAGLTAFGAAAQEARVPFGGLEHDPSLPVEINADGLELDQARGTAIFAGNVTVGQGSLRLGADRIEVFYADADGTGRVERMLATGNVTLTNGAEAAEAQQATYTVSDGIIELEGEVLLTQGQNALSSERLRIDLAQGTGVLEGRVQTVFVPGQAP